MQYASLGRCFAVNCGVQRQSTQRLCVPLASGCHPTRSREKSFVIKPAVMSGLLPRAEMETEMVVGSAARSGRFLSRLGAPHFSRWKGNPGGASFLFTQRVDCPVASLCAGRAAAALYRRTKDKGLRDAVRLDTTLPGLLPSWTPLFSDTLLCFDATPFRLHSFRTSLIQYSLFRLLYFWTPLLFPDSPLHLSL